MKPENILTAVTVLILLLSACSPAAVPTLDAQSTKTAVTATAAAKVTQEAALFPLAEPGPYPVGWRSYTMNDASRDNRRVGITIWYPAVKGADTGAIPLENAEPDFSSAPYPLLLSSTKLARIFAPYLVSRGFTWASVNLIDTYAEMQEQMYEQPLDILFALEQAASNPPEDLEGMIDADRAGAMGYSFDGYNALAMSGARIDPVFYLSQCESLDARKSHELSSFSCKPARDWDAFTAGAGELLTASEDGLWQPMTDERILAVMPMACEGWWLFGEQGLAAVDRPVLILDGSADELYQENTQIFQYLGTADKGLVSFIGEDHMMIFDSRQIARMAHFAAAFLGYHLQGNEDLAQYFSEDFVDRHVDIHWGVYRGVHIPKE